MWKTEELQLLFALFGAPPTVLDAVHTHSLTHHDMDHMTTASLVHMGVSSKRVSAALVAQWKSQYSHQDPYVALEDIERAMEVHKDVLAYKAESSGGDPSGDPHTQHTAPSTSSEAVRNTHLLAIIHEQKARITELENQEIAYIEELEKSAQLITEQQAVVNELQQTTLAKSMNTDDIKRHLTQHHDEFYKKIDETKVNVGNVDHHISSILRMAQQTVEIIQEEERVSGNASGKLHSSTGKTRQVHIEKIAIDNLRKVCDKNIKMSDDGNGDDDDLGGVTLDPFVAFKLPSAVAETKKILHSDVSPSWDKLNIELQAIDSESESDSDREKSDKLMIEVWDEYSMGVANELLCSGFISFTHLDLLDNRGPVTTSVDLFDSNGEFVSTAKLDINVIVGELCASRIGFSTESNAKTYYEVNDSIICDFGGEGNWLPGRIIKAKKIRDRTETNLLYEVEFKNGDVEVNVPAVRLRPAKVPKPPPKSASKGAVSADGNDNSNEEKAEQTELGMLFDSNSAELLEAITEVQSRSHGTIATVMELDTWQKKLTQLLSDALKRYFEINAAAKKYSIFVNSLTEKVGNIDIFLQRLEVSEKKCDDLTAGGELLRSEIEDLRKQLVSMTEQRDSEIDRYQKTQHLLEKEKEVTLDCKKEIIELRSELDHLVEVVRRDMSNRITSKNVNEELYSLSSNLVKKDIQSGAPSPSPMSGSHNISATDHDDIFMQQHDWKLYMSLIKENMSPREVSEAHATLHNLQRSFEILSSRLLLECRHRSECEFKLSGAKEDLRDIRDKIIIEGTLRIQLQEELQYFKEQADTFKEEVEKHKKFSAIAKKAAYDAINQARHYQRKLSQEIDNISDAGFGESKSANNRSQQLGGSGGESIKGTPNKQKKFDLDEFDGMFDDTTDEDASDAGIGRRKLTRSTTAYPKGNSPYLSSRNKSRSRSHNLQTRSESEKDHHGSQATSSSKKSKKIKMPGKKQMSYVGKKISRVLFDSKGNKAGVAPYDDSKGAGPKSPGGRTWKNPNYIDYAKKYGKEPPTAASRRSYTSGQHYE